MFTYLVNSLSTHDAAILKVAFDEINAGATVFETKTQSGLVELTSRFGC